MDPIIVVGPDGVEVEFPAGTDDATIERAMAEAYPSETALDPATAGADEGHQDQEASVDPFEGQAGLQRDYRGRIDVNYPNLDLNKPAHMTWYNAANRGELNPNMPLGSNENPYVLDPGMSDRAIQELIDAGVTFIDSEGRMQRKADDLLGAQVGVMQPFNNAAGWLEGGLERLGVPVDAINNWTADNLGMARGTEGARENLQNTLDEATADGRRPGRAGQFVGSMVATAPLALATRNPWLLGAGEGALTSNADDAMGLARDAALGAVVGKGGDVVLRGLGSAIDPRIDPATRRLVEQGVEVSPGQLLGGLAHRTEDAMTGVPAIGDIPNAAQRRAQESVATVALQRPMTSIGVEMPRNLNSVHEQVDFAQRAVSDAYDELIPQLDLRLDPDFGVEFRSLDANVRNMQPDQVHQWDQLIRNEVMPRFNSVQGVANGRITGESFKELESVLGREVRDFTASASPHDRRYASAVRELQAQLRDMLARNNPNHAERLAGINDAYRQLAVIEDAVNRAPAGSRGRFTPQQLEQAARNADPSIRRRAAARGDALFQDLAEDAGSVMTRTVNDSGTATRGAITAGLGAAFFGSTLNVSVNPWAVGALALGALPYNRTGNRVFTSMMTQRPAMATPIRDMLDQNSWMAAMASSANNQIDRNENRRNSAEANEDAELRNRWMALQQQAEAQAAGADLEGLY